VVSAINLRLEIAS